MCTSAFNRNCGHRFTFQENDLSTLQWNFARKSIKSLFRENLLQITVTQQKINWKPFSGRSRENECYKRLIYKQFVQVSGLCGPQFASYLPKRCTHLYRALHGDAILVHRFGALIWPPQTNNNFWGSLFLWKLFFFTRELEYVRINISSNTWNGYTAENQEERLFFNETAFLFWCHALWKLGSSNCCIFNMKHATGMETFVLFIFNLV